MPAPKTSKRTPLEAAQSRNQIARLNLDTEVRKRKLDAIQNGYDATTTTTKRRQPKIERQGEGGILNQQKRLKAANIGRDLERNFSPAKAILHQFRVNVVGAMGKIRINIEGGEQGAKWYNSVFAKSPDFRNDDHWSTMLGNAVTGIQREGDQLWLFDDGVIEDTGKCLVWESDQIAPLSDKLFKEAVYKDKSDSDTQDNGIIRDKWGREIAYVVSDCRGKTLIDDAEGYTIFPRGVARLVRNPWRPNQGRGVPSILTPATQIEDLYEILVTELQAAKRVAQVAGVVKRSDAVADYDDPGTAPEFLGENVGKATATTDAEAANGTDPTARNYEALEAMSTYLEYLDKDDTFELLDPDRPNINLTGFIDAVMCQAGSSMGLAQVYTTLKASTSYTAFRGEMILSWATFTMLQKWLERSVADWVAVKALRWAERTGRIDALPAGWEEAISWAWPKMPSVDPKKEADAIRVALKNGTVTFADLLGPEWEKILRGYADQVNVVKETELPLSVLESMSGNVIEEETETDDE